MPEVLEYYDELPIGIFRSHHDVGILFSLYPRTCTTAIQAFQSAGGGNPYAFWRLGISRRECGVSVRLDQLGNGTYDWQDGYFETHSLSQGLWKGSWRQMGNDREGEFEAILSESGDSAQGRWWYTRIEMDHQPLQPGGHFVLTRLPPRIGE